MNDVEYDKRITSATYGLSHNYFIEMKSK